MNPHAPAPVGLLSLASSLYRNRFLISQMTKREVIGRYRGSLLGLFWSFATPVILLAMYTFVFSVVFNARWGTGPSGGRSDFAVFLFVGMIVHALFSETLLRAPGLILGNVNFVKKIVFPLEVLPVVAMGASVFHALVSLLALGGAMLLWTGGLPWTWLFLPVVLLPLLVLALGIAWVLASLGVFIRDIAHPIGLLTTLLLFASPVFYPLSALPAGFRQWLVLNPLTFIIEQARAVLIDGRAPDLRGLALYSLVALAVAAGGYAWFQKTRRGFANVI